jgi:soluble lytic murein transglycosylase-like protein/outer membrane protein assembly factor BamD (BamD/ComL family)
LKPQSTPSVESHLPKFEPPTGDAGPQLPDTKQAAVVPDTEQAAVVPVTKPKVPAQLSRLWSGDDFPLAPYLRYLPHIPYKQQLSAWQSLASGHYAKAMSLLTASIEKIEPKHRPDSMLALADLSMSLADYERAIAIYSTLLSSPAIYIRMQASVMLARHYVENKQAQLANKILHNWPNKLVLPKTTSTEKAEAKTKMPKKRDIEVKKSEADESSGASGVAVSRASIAELWVAGHVLRTQSARHTGRIDIAQQSYRTLIQAKSPLADWAAYQLLALKVRKRRHVEVIKQSESWLRNYPTSRWSRRVSLLRAQASEQVGNCEQAIKLYRNLAASGSDYLMRYALLGEARCMLLSKSKSIAYQKLMTIIRRFAGTAHAREALRLLQQHFPKATSTLQIYFTAYHAYKAMQWTQAAKLFDQFLVLAMPPKGSSKSADKEPSKGPNKNANQEPSKDSGKSKGQSKDSGKSKGQSKDSSKSNGQSKDSGKSKGQSKDSGKIDGKGQEDKIGNKGQKAVKHKSERQRQARSRTGVAEQFIPLAAYYKAQALFQAKRNIDARSAAQWMIKRFPRHQKRLSAEILLIRANYRQERDLDAVRKYERFWRQHSKVTVGRNALWWAAQLYSEHGEQRRSIEMFDTYFRTYTASQRRWEARIKMALVAYQYGQYKRCIELLKSLLKLRSDLSARAHFWTGKAYEQLKQPKLAIASFRRIGAFSDSYYVARARQRLFGTKLLASGALPLYDLLSNEELHRSEQQQMINWFRRTSPKQDIDELARKLQAHKAYRRAYVFALAGMLDETRAEFNSLQISQPFELYLIARAWLAFGSANRAIYTSQIFSSRLSPAQRRYLPIRPLLRLSFPIPFPHLYASYGQRYGLCPVLMLSLTRQESLFHPSIVSGAGARGIAQIMPKDALYLAKKLGIRNYHPQHLDRVATNLQMGFVHFRNYLNRHNGDVELTLAAYNAGPHSLARWVKEHPKLHIVDREAFIEYGIGFRETRQYVRNCLRWYSVYRNAFSATPKH